MTLTSSTVVYPTIGPGNTIPYSLNRNPICRNIDFFQRSHLAPSKLTPNCLLGRVHSLLCTLPLPAASLEMEQRNEGCEYAGFIKARLPAYSFSGTWI